MIIAILGRQPAIGIAELERVFGGNNVSPLSNQAVKIDSELFEIQSLGSIPKAGRQIFEIESSDWRKVSQRVAQHYTDKWSKHDGKITLGISAYGFKISEREVQKTGIILKQKLKKIGISLRLIPNLESAHNTAVSHHNKLGLSPNKIELIIVRTNNNKTIVAESMGSQNISAYAKRDQGRPKRDAFVGMLPPKLAQIMLNLACGQLIGSDEMTILDPFCGTGVILQEAALMGYSVYGTDLSDKMISYSRDNLNWLADSHRKEFDWYLHKGDAMNTQWRQPISAVVCESYLGQPFSAPPSPSKLIEVIQNCDHIISEFLINLGKQVESGAPICIAVPAWRDKDGNFNHLPLISKIARFGYKPHEFVNISQNDLLYFREDQVVARELLVLSKI